MWCYPQFINRDAIVKRKEAILVEGIGDMLSMVDSGMSNVIVTFGVDISSTILSYLLKLDVSRIVIAFNNDKEKNMAGNNAAYENMRNLTKYFDEHQVIVALPTKKNDFGEMTKEEILEWKTQNQK